ncbi:hypothetical protein L207DRAFT_527240 [Hyaloscypha variabilis F]|uniref:Zn(2)-C6 fungal-type domain-containing protein n=1 Tax=Hyaloscypha variabilis (strain UAMH 11265 / GT02V1 / F) TaxID=1149755 RepID=A0A2J6RUX5_HYAVF|nr:hypothetical protein L207DRAFT_527240 [Hyaloscypha variabilis F]
MEWLSQRQRRVVERFEAQQTLSLQNNLLENTISPPEMIHNNFTWQNLHPQQWEPTFSLSSQLQSAPYPQHLQATPTQSSLSSHPPLYYQSTFLQSPSQIQTRPPIQPPIQTQPPIQIQPPPIPHQAMDKGLKDPGDEEDIAEDEEEADKNEDEEAANMEVDIHENRRPASSRVRMACQPCHKMKMRCNGQRPCSQCKERGNTCSYKAPKRAGRPRASQKQKRRCDIPSPSKGQNCLYEMEQLPPTPPRRPPHSCEPVSQLPSSSPRPQLSPHNCQTFQIQCMESQYREEIWKLEALVVNLRREVEELHLQVKSLTHQQLIVNSSNSFKVEEVG